MSEIPRKMVMVVEDDPEIRALLGAFLTREGFEVELAADGTAMDRVLRQRTPDLVILDLMLPGEDGLSICRRLRSRSSLPILFLTAKGDDTDRIVGLELGADDYITKPFNPRELLARMRAVLRRAGRLPADGQPRRRFVFASFLADLDARYLETTAGTRVPLTSAEFDLLVCFVERPQRVLSRDQLIDWTRGRSAEPWDRTIDVTVSRLRRKLASADSSGGALVTTVRNGGYLFAADVREA
jgi:two-component system OmpR family response regulator